MPIHEYVCKKCKNQFDIFYTSQSAVEREEKDEKCPKCSSTKKKRLIKNTSFVLKGSGWAKDRYK